MNSCQLLFSSNSMLNGISSSTLYKPEFGEAVPMNSCSLILITLYLFIIYVLNVAVEHLYLYSEHLCMYYCIIVLYRKVLELLNLLNHTRITNFLPKSSLVSILNIVFSFKIKSNTSLA